MSTISQVLRGVDNSWISEATRSRVREAAEQFGYRANRAASLLAARKGHFFGIAVRQARSAIMLDPVRAVGAVAIDAGYTPFVVETSSLPASHYDDIESLGDGVVFISPDPNNFQNRIQRLRTGVAAVVGSRPFHSGLPEFIWNEQDGWDQVIDHLAEQGHRHIALLAGKDGNPTRIDGFQTSCASRNIDPVIIRSDQEIDRYRAGRQMIERVLSSRPDVTATIGRNMEFALGAMAEVQQRGLRLPGHLSVVSFTDSALADGIWPRLTTLRTPVLEASRMAAKLTVAALAGEKIEPTVTTVPVTLIEGETTGPPHAVVERSGMLV